MTRSRCSRELHCRLPWLRPLFCRPHGTYIDTFKIQETSQAQEAPERISNTRLGGDFIQLFDPVNLKLEPCVVAVSLPGFRSTFTAPRRDAGLTLEGFVCGDLAALCKLDVLQSQV